jgi:hypothetical protein
LLVILRALRSQESRNEKSAGVPSLLPTPEYIGKRLRQGHDDWRVVEGEEQKMLARNKRLRLQGKNIDLCCSAMLICFFQYCGSETNFFFLSGSYVDLNFGSGSGFGSRIKSGTGLFMKNTLEIQII